MKTWIDPQPVTVPADLREAVGGHPLIAETLARRGFTDVSAAKAFLDPDCYTPAPASDLPDMERAVARIERAIRAGEQICVWGDFDVDGQTSTALLVAALRERGASVGYHVPLRETEGHGVNIPALQQIIDQGAQLIVTCDTAITAHEAVDYANSRGVDTVITDHHTLAETLPDAYAVVNPKRLPENHPLRELPGVGAAYKLIEALYAGAETDHLLDLVALGIVADVAVQTGDTRYLLQRGLQILRSTERVGLQALIELAEIDPVRLSEEHIAFELGPRMNALGRLADANQAVELLTTNDLTTARTLATQLERLNSERRLMSNQVYLAAQEQIDKDPSLLNESALVLAGESWPPGVVGIVASRLVEQYNRPVLLIAAPAGGLGKGSARSVGDIDITAMIRANAQYLQGYGGHKLAAGLSLDPAEIPAFRRALSRTIRKTYGDLRPEPTVEISGYIDLKDVTLDLVAEIERLAPFGMGNPPLTLAARALTIKSKRTVGRTGDHLLLTVEDQAGHTQKVIWWGGGDQELPRGAFDLAFVARANNYRGKRDLQIEWIDVRPAGGALEFATPPTVKVIDQRQAPDPVAALRALRHDHPDLQVWGEVAPNLEGVRGRSKLEPAAALAIWTLPPSPNELRAVLEHVNPQTIILLGVDPGLDTLESFATRLAGLVKHTINQKGGQAPLDALAEACAHSPVTVRAGIERLVAHGQIALVGETDGAVTIARGAGHADERAVKLVTNRLTALLAETAAYRSYLTRLDAAAFARLVPVSVG
ncbi:MAG: single-stranded-DNA-specific exonuclease RecJ [Chloroflexi bacterium]|nr:single-stranded-DNA-specific exonuclease RecJ [Chloroflexota bacterium]